MAVGFGLCNDEPKCHHYHGKPIFSPSFHMASSQKRQRSTRLLYFFFFHSSCFHLGFLPFNQKGEKDLGSLEGNNMLRNSPTLRRSLGRNLPCRRLNRRRRRSSSKGNKKKAAVVKSGMEMKNLKLYMQNKIIIQENEKLREQALLLHRENQDLLFQLQKLFSKPHSGGGGCQLASSTSNYS